VLPSALISFFEAAESGVNIHTFVQENYNKKNENDVIISFINILKNLSKQRLLIVSE
jgi:hypothetical protein